MTAASDYLENEVLDHVLSVGSYTMPAGVYVKLHIGVPGETGSANAAAESTRKAATFGAASGGTGSTTADIAWTSVSTTETYSHFSIWDAVTAGNCLLVGALTSSVSMTAGEDFTIPSGDLDITLA